MYGLKSSCWKRFAATYAVVRSKCDGSMIDTRVNFPANGGVTLVHVTLLSVDSCTRPSSDPAHRMFAEIGDSAKAKIVAYHSVPVMSYVIGPPARMSVFGSCRVKSWLIGSQLSPSLSERNTRFA